MASDFRYTFRNRKKLALLTRERLPLELVSMVLKRLPARCVLKCKCVCKSWFDLINDPHFISNHFVFYNNLIHSQAQEEHLLVLRLPHIIYHKKAYISVVSWNVNDPTKRSTLLFPPDFEIKSEQKSYRFIEIMGPCNGIYLLQSYFSHFMMNPSLRQIIVLPRSKFPAPPWDDYSLSGYAGFGFDPKTNDYKVVVIKYKNPYDENRIGDCTVELYTLNSNSWRKLDVAFPLQSKICDSSRQVYTYVNDCCHWLGSKVEDVVVAFDMVNESFRKIKVPPNIRCFSGRYFDSSTMVPFNESATIGVIVHCFSEDQTCYDVWVMKDYWDEGSWIKKCTVGLESIPGITLKQLVGFYGSNKFLWWDADGNRLVLYDPDSKVKTKDLQVFGRHDSIRAARYMESLVSLRRGKDICQQFLSCRSRLGLFGSWSHDGSPLSRVIRFIRSFF